MCRNTIYYFILVMAMAIVPQAQAQTQGQAQVQAQVQAQNVMEAPPPPEVAQEQIAPLSDTVPLEQPIPTAEIETQTEPIAATEIQAPNETETMPDEFGTRFNQTNDNQYTLGVNDLVEVTVLRHPEVSGEFMINNDGQIQYEFVGDISVAGLTKNEASKVIAEALSRYIISPEVTVKITGYNSKVVYVIGEVSHPGKIYMRGDTITIREALIQAGLPTLSAKGKKSSLITPSADGKPRQIQVNVDKLLMKGDLRENYVMKPGDTLYVPPTAMAKVMRVIQPVAAPISTAAGTGRTVMTGF